jgi:hypothetical protein
MLHHNGFSAIAIASERNNNSACILISREEVVIKVYPCVLALTYILLLVQNEGEVAGNGAFMDQTQISLLDNGAGTDTVADHLQNKEATLAVELREFESLSMPQVAWFIAIVKFLLMLGNQTVKVDIGGEVRHVFAEIVVGVDLENLHLHLLDVFDIDKKLDCLIYSKALFVIVSKLDVGSVLKLVNH